jgi:hypothetical protein
VIPLEALAGVRILAPRLLPPEEHLDFTLGATLACYVAAFRGPDGRSVYQVRLLDLSRGVLIEATGMTFSPEQVLREYRRLCGVEITAEEILPTAGTRPENG